MAGGKEKGGEKKGRKEGEKMEGDVPWLLGDRRS